MRYLQARDYVKNLPHPLYEFTAPSPLFSPRKTIFIAPGLNYVIPHYPPINRGLRIATTGGTGP